VKHFVFSHPPVKISLSPWKGIASRLLGFVRKIIGLFLSRNVAVRKNSRENCVFLAARRMLWFSVTLGVDCKYLSRSRKAFSYFHGNAGISQQRYFFIERAFKPLITRLLKISFASRSSRIRHVRCEIKLRKITCVLVALDIPIFLSLFLSFSPFPSLSSLSLHVSFACRQHSGSRLLTSHRAYFQRRVVKLHALSRENALNATRANRARSTKPRR